MPGDDTVLDDREIFDAAIADDEPVEQPEEPLEPEAEPEPSPEPEKAQERDEQGRFKAEEGGEEPEPDPRAEPERADAIPPWRLNEVSARAREAEQRAAALEAELRQLRASQRQAEETRKTEEEAPKDFWDNPDAYLDHRMSAVERKIEQTQRNMIEGTSRRLAIREYGEDAVQNAYQAFSQHVQSVGAQNSPEYASVMRSDDPFGDIVSWHQRQQTLQTVGNDPDAWFEQKLAERLNDPKFQASLAERVRGTAAANGQSSPEPEVQLPPSLSRMTGTASGNEAMDDGDMSNEALYRHAIA